MILPFLTLLSLFANSLLFDNHGRLVNGKCHFPLLLVIESIVVVTGSQLPPLSALFDPSRVEYSQHTTEPSSRLDRLLRNPFSLVPVGASAFILLTSVIIPS